MMLVVDANILFSAIIKAGKTAEIIVSDKVKLITPEFVLSEIRDHKDEILSKAHRSPEDFSKFLSIVEYRIEVIPSFKLVPFLKGALSILPGHTKDMQYFAAALKYDSGIWSNDKILKTQSKVKVYSTSELLKYLGLRK